MTQYQPLSADDPRRLGAYDVVARLGEGGQGVVYLGRASSGEQVAIKLLHRALVADPEARGRFLREVAVAQRVARFSTAPVLHADLDGSRPYIVSEYVPGPSLRELVQNEGPRRGASLERIAISTATALAAIHRAGILHRDFKPANVLMGPEGPVVIDFGVARALDSPGTTATGMSVGTPAYLAPEQLSGHPVSEAADVFAWGVTMVYAATGKPAFGADTIPAVMNRILHQEPLLEGLDGSLLGLVAECLSKDPAQRPTADRLVLRLTGQPIPASAIEPVAAPSTPPGIAPLPPMPPAPPLGGQGPAPLGGQGPAPLGGQGPAPLGGQGPSAAGPGGAASAGGGATEPGARHGARHGARPDPVPPRGPVPPVGHVPPVGGPAPSASPVPPAVPDREQLRGGLTRASSRRRQAQPQRRGLMVALSGAAALAIAVGAGIVITQAGQTSQAAGLVAAGGPTAEGGAAGGNPGGQHSSDPNGPDAHGPDGSADPTDPNSAAVSPEPSGTITLAPPKPTRRAVTPPSTRPTTRPTTKPSTKPTPTRKPTPSKTPSNSPSKSPSKSPSPTPSKTPTKAPTPTPSKTPTVKPTPTPTKTTAAPKPNPYTAAGVCGSGYKVIDSRALGTVATVYLLYNGTRNCVVTLSKYVSATKVPASAVLQVKGGATATDSGSFTAYAGPVRLAAAKTCVIWGGSWAGKTFKSGWSHCG
ncbi:serine/threonine-protein kinase [Nonomuraea soli]|uniref:non-specific serine/threonine protein kinase n=1 Tax=Nonomuraea soli TaxID=1032476 RepID=A0A7W0CPA9_9ACTN|nr:serine/threonine-protein kinase [Nonomuraea soli]MBA2894837.1 putative Ser/Thr protein kinase/cell division protein FtsN [Nonomuraea soli]